MHVCVVCYVHVCGAVCMCVVYARVCCVHVGVLCVYVWYCVLVCSVCV